MCSLFENAKTDLKDEIMETRINRFLSEAGVCSRRAADKYIQEGQVIIDGKVAELGSKVTEDSEVVFCGRKITSIPDKCVIAFNKPVGITCTSSRDDKDNIIDYIGYRERLFTVGRLDKNSCGLILLTNDGDSANNITKVSNNHEKEYVVTVNRDITDDFLRGMAEGVPILGKITRKCRIWKSDDRTFHIILMQGLNRQIRRMCAYFGYNVVKLKRIRVMNIKLAGLLEGTYRKIEGEELMELLKESNKTDHR